MVQSLGALLKRPIRGVFVLVCPIETSPFLQKGEVYRPIFQVKKRCFSTYSNLYKPCTDFLISEIVQTFVMAIHVWQDIPANTSAAVGQCSING